jgi:protein-disulfide isomerase
MFSFDILSRPATLAASLALALAACGGASSDEPAPSNAAKEPAAKAEATGALADMAIGAEDAPVTVIEYASVTCPHCATFNETIYPEIKANYVDTGKVRFVFREFPTAPVELSVVGSMLARCAADKGGPEAFFMIVDSLFKTQGRPGDPNSWIYGENPRNALIKIASQAGMDEAAFDACLKRQELLDLINENVSGGRDAYDVNSTPSFIINGSLRHFSTAEDMSKALDEALEKAAE